MVSFSGICRSSILNECRAEIRRSPIKHMLYFDNGDSCTRVDGCQFGNVAMKSPGVVTFGTSEPSLPASTIRQATCKKSPSYTTPARRSEERRVGKECKSRE